MTTLMSSEETSDTVDSVKAMILVKEDCVVSVPVSLCFCDRDLRRCGAETDDVKNPNDCDARLTVRAMETRCV